MKTINKLVRGKIPNIIFAQGKIPHFYRIENDQDYYDALCTKLLEETNEFLASRELEELVDIAEIFYAILKFQDIDLKTFKAYMKCKRLKNGDYNDRIFLQTIE